jgi:hypothetical protein
MLVIIAATVEARVTGAAFIKKFAACLQDPVVPRSH